MLFSEHEVVNQLSKSKEDQEHDDGINPVDEDSHYHGSRRRGSWYLSGS